MYSYFKYLVKLSLTNFTRLNHRPRKSDELGSGPNQKKIARFKRLENSSLYFQNNLAFLGRIGKPSLSDLTHPHQPNPAITKCANLPRPFMYPGNAESTICQMCFEKLPTFPKTKLITLLNFTTTYFFFIQFKMMQSSPTTSIYHSSQCFIIPYPCCIPIKEIMS